MTWLLGYLAVGVLVAWCLHGPGRKAWGSRHDPLYKVGLVFAVVGWPYELLYAALRTVGHKK